MTQARIIHTSTATCRPSTGKNRTIDFFMVALVLADAIENPKVDLQSPFRPHSPVELTFKRVCDIPWARVTCLVASGSPTPINGPQEISESIWDDLHKALLEQWEKPHPDISVMHKLARTWDVIAQIEAGPLFGRKQTAGLELETKLQPLAAALSTKSAAQPTPSMAIRALINVCKTLANPLQYYQWEELRTSVTSKKRAKWYSTHLLLEHMRSEEYEKDLYDAILVGKDTYAKVVHILDNTPPHERDEPRPELLQLLPSLCTAQDSLYSNELHHKHTSWKGWIAKATEGSASQAHALSKRPDLPPLRLAEAAQSYPKGSGITKDTSATSVLKEAHAKWKTLWVSDHPPPSWQDVTFPQPTLKTITQLRETAKSFKNKTTKVDGWHPKQFGYLSDKALTTLSILFGLYEKTGIWAEHQQDLLVCLIPKPDGDRRPILHFRSAFRLWSRCSQDAVRKWAKVNANDP